MSDGGFVIRGLPNLNATCYLNSILQCIINIPHIRSLLNTNNDKLNIENDGNNVCNAFENFIFSHINKDSSALEHSQALIIFVRNFISYYQNFSSGMQDQHEYLMLLFKIIHDCRSVNCTFTVGGTVTNELERLELLALDNLRKDGMWISSDNLNQTLKGNDNKGYHSCIFEGFTGQVHAQTRCVLENCKYVSDRFEVFRSLEIDIGNDECSLESCLENYIKETQLDESELYECYKCKQKNRSIRKFSLWRLPRVLIITLKRFNSSWDKSRQTLVSVKNNINILIPEQLDVKNFQSTSAISKGKTIYDLRSVAHHIGNQNSGHCYSYVKAPNNIWFNIDDTNIRQISEQNSQNIISGSTPYLLFYHLRDSN